MKPLTCFIAYAISLCCYSANAEVFERDWKEPGDGLLTYDDVNNREWLDLPVSRLSQFPEPIYENAFAETLPGGMFEGFTVATSQDAIDLSVSAGIDPTSQQYEVHGEAMTRLVLLLGPTYERDPGVPRAIGLSSDIDEGRIEPEPPFELGSRVTVAWLPHPPNNRARMSLQASSDLFTPSRAGLLLYRDAIPEPSSLGLAVLSVLFLATTIWIKARRS